ncbi:hypothetical protein [Neobacillus kokaensis]|uniref:hypothetical protein n=1 Tax=Neobacillus kokaensis TaxID=2759023 RepID=UPI00174862C9|nr:hypothetical protein [Neobacillus kokaensis]
MLVVEAIKKVHRHFTLIFLPVMFDLLSFVVGWLMVGMDGKERISIRLILEMGLPSVSHVSNIPLFANNIDLLKSSGNLPSFSWLIVIGLIIIGAFLQGGYISFLFSIVNGKAFDISNFLHAGKKNWIQFIFLWLILFLGKISVTAFLVLMFKIIGVFAALVLFICLRILFIYLEFTIVVDGVSMAAAFKTCRGYLKKSLFPSFSLIFIMYFISSLMSYLIHMYWGPYSIIASIFVYGYLMSVIQTIFMMILCRTRDELNYQIKAA